MNKVLFIFFYKLDTEELFFQRTELKYISDSFKPIYPIYVISTPVFMSCYTTNDYITISEDLLDKIILNAEKTILIYSFSEEKLKSLVTDFLNETQDVLKKYTLRSNNIVEFLNSLEVH